MMRCTYVFQYLSFNSLLNSHEVIAKTSASMKDSINAPKQGHIALTDDKDTLAVMFNSASNRTPEVVYGIHPDLQEAARRTGTSTTYGAHDLCVELIFRVDIRGQI